MKKKLITLTIAALLVSGMVLTCIPASAAEIVEDIPTIQSFTDDPVAEDDLITIVTAGINAPSAINQQPWHFSVVTDPAVFEEINGGSSGESADAESAEGESAEGESEDVATAEGESEGTATTANASVGDSPVVIIISCADSATGTNPAFDAGLAAMTMYNEANLLGYGAKIVSSPTMTLNGARQDEFREMLGIPEDMSAIAVLLIGMPAMDEADIISSASERNDMEDVVTFIAEE